MADMDNEYVTACVVLGVFGTLALIASGVCADLGAPSTGTAFGVVGACLYAAAAAIWWRGK